MPAGIETTDLNSIALPSGGPFGPAGGGQLTGGPFAAATDVTPPVDDHADDTTIDDAPQGDQPAATSGEVDYDDAEQLFAEISSATNKVITPKKVTTPPADDQGDDTTDNDDLDPDPAPLPAKSAAKPSVLPGGKPAPKPRDYSDLDEEDAKLARNMGGRSFDRFKAAVKELKKLPALEKELTTLKSDTTALRGALDHPDGYVLTPEYSEATSTFNLAQQEVNFLQEQLARAHDGKPCKILQKSVDATGKVQYSAVDVPQPSAATVAQLTNDQQSANIRLHQAYGQLSTLPARHAEARQRFVTEFNSFQSKAIEPLWNGFKSDPSIAAKAEAMEKGLLAQIPSHMRRNELAPALARSLTLVFLMAERKAGELKQSTQSEFAKRERKAAGVVKSTPRLSGGNNPGDIYDNVTDEEFLSLKNR